jgi:hypothetical protein
MAGNGTSIVRRPTGSAANERLDFAAVHPAACSRGGLCPPAPAEPVVNQGDAMQHQKQAAQGSAAPAQRSLKFHEMTLGQKTVFILKLTVSILSFGFLYPHILID